MIRVTFPKTDRCGGKQTPNIDKFWSGCLGKAVKGIEIGGLGVVDVDNHTALSLESVQPPNHRGLQVRGQSLVNHYAQIIALFYSTDLELNGYLIYRYYKARFQIEFLFRDTKQYMGLSQCQSRSESKLYFHRQPTLFNTSLTAVGVAKAAHYLTQEKNQRKSFSLASIKSSYFNELMRPPLRLNLFLSNFQIDPNLQKNRAIYEKIIHYGRIAS